MEAVAVTWQPIDTAPKDGTPVVILDRSPHYGNEPKGTGYLVARFRKPRLGDWNYPDGRWEAMYGPCSAHSPSHWMPLPEPPK